jgi:MFS family permease
MGSLAFIISSIIVGYFLDIFTNFPALFIYIHIAFLLMSAILMSKQINTYNMTTTYNRSLLKDLFLLLKDFKFINLILILAISNSIIMVSQSYLSLSILDLHGNSEIVGYSTFFMVIPEVLLFGLAIKLTRRYKHLTLICIGVLSMILRWSLLLITHNLVILLLASFGHGLIMALVIVVGFDLIKKIVDTHLLSSALSFFVSISNLFIAIISLLVGYTIDHFSVQTSYLIYLVFSFFVVILIINYYRIIKT